MVTLIILVILVNVITFFVPKRRTKIELFSTGTFAILFAVLADVYLSFKYGLYWYFANRVTWSWLITLFGLKPQISALFINYFPLSTRFYKKMSYIFGWAVFSTVFEWIVVYTAGVLHYRTWHIWHSAMVYPLILIIITANFYFVRHLLKNNKWF